MELQYSELDNNILADKNQEISETSAVALGILANPKSIPALKLLLTDHVDGRKLVGQPEVNYRTRAFAAYGLGLIGARASKEVDRKDIVTILRTVLESDTTKTRDLKVSCIIAMGLVPLETITSDVQPEKKGMLVPPETSRIAQLDYLMAFLQNDEHNYLVRAHCPTALARLLQGLPAEARSTYRARIAELLERPGAGRAAARPEARARDAPARPGRPGQGGQRTPRPRHPRLHPERLPARPPWHAGHRRRCFRQASRPRRRA